MKTYISTNARPCAGCGIRYYCVCENVEETVPISPAMSYQRSDGLTVTAIAGPDEWLSITGVIRAVDEGPQSHAEPVLFRRRVPVWPLASIMLGLVLVAIGIVLREPTSWLIYEAIHR